jgi:hypothetical protein
LLTVVAEEGGVGLDDEPERVTCRDSADVGLGNRLSLIEPFSARSEVINDCDRPGCQRSVNQEGGCRDPRVAT